MRKIYDFSQAKRAKDVPHLDRLQASARPTKMLVTMWIDTEVITAFREKSERLGTGYQTEMNRVLREIWLKPPLTEARLKAVVEDSVRELMESRVGVRAHQSLGQ